MSGPQLIIKGVRVPVGTVINGRKKMGEGKWVDVKTGKTGNPPKQEEPKTKKKKSSHDFAKETPARCGPPLIACVLPKRLY